MSRKFKNMPTAEQQYAAQQAPVLRAQADRHDAKATAAYREMLRDSWDGPISDDGLEQARADRATAQQLRAQADQAEAAVKPQKRRWSW